MRECQQCGEANQASSRFCVVCGAPLAAVSSPGAGPVGESPEAAARPPGGPASPAGPSASPSGPPWAGQTPGPAGGTNRPNTPAAAPRKSDPTGDFPLDGPRTLVGFLVSFENLELGQYWPIHQGRNVLGRQGAATGLDIEVAHPTTSSLHAVLLARARPGRVAIEDTTSTNGTFVNENLLSPGQRWELRDGDRLRFGLFNATIKIVQTP